jgi:hypothetical protein
MRYPLATENSDEPWDDWREPTRAHVRLAPEQERRKRDSHACRQRSAYGSYEDISGLSTAAVAAPAL